MAAPARQPRPRPPRELGVVSGYLLKLLRESIDKTQAQLAEALEVDLATVQGWESGRRPLTATRTADTTKLRMRMLRLGSPAWAVQLLGEALEADHFLSVAVDAGDRPLAADEHPMAAFVLRRTLIEMIVWPFTGTLPPKLSQLPVRPRRGPVAAHPVLDAEDRTRFFDHMLVTADAAQGRTPLLYRQPLFLLSLDQRPSTAGWLRSQYRQALSRRGELDMHAWMVARSAAISLARQGDREPLRWFVSTHMVDELQATANLNYWAYWLGEVHDTQPDDTYVTDLDHRSWSGSRVTEHLLDNLDNPAQADLNIRSLWTLLQARPLLLEQHTHLRDRATVTVGRAHDELTDSPARADLARLADRIRLAAS